jgi:hypothetical protein
MRRSSLHEGFGTRGQESRLIAFLNKIWLHIWHTSFIIGPLSLVWFAIRTGTKPSRAAYPCQQAAAANSYAWLAAFIFPIFSKARIRFRQPNVARNLILIAVAALAIIATGVLSVCKMGGYDGGDDVGETPAGLPVKLSLPESLAKATPASDIFVLQGTSGNDVGLWQLMDLMGRHNLPFYNSPVANINRGPTGLIGRDDIVIIKVNSQWDERGGTNTDLLSDLMAAICQHPDEFTGEIIFADNGQAQQGPTGQGGSFNYTRNNAAEISQSVQKVADKFPSSYKKVSTYLWDTITTNRVKEYSEGDMADGYIVDEAVNPRTGLIVSYPKFKTKYGTYISFKLGIWNPQQQTYDSDRLKVINVPVLKSHDDFGVSACVKHYMGVLSYKLTEQLGTNAHEAILTGGLGTEMVETRFPALNILDAIWVNSFPGAGPVTGYGDATNAKVIAASRDPVALDYWASKHILVQAAKPFSYGRRAYLMDPDNVSEGSFGQWLRLSMQEINQAGYQTTVDEAHMNVYVSQYR